jgi:hypothetical protein
MSDVQSAVIAEPPGFNEFTRFIRRLTGLLERVMKDLTRVRGLDSDFQEVLADVIRDGTVRRRSDQVVEQLAAVDTNDLIIHGLDDNSLDMRLKMAAFDMAIRRSRYVETEENGSFTFAPRREPITEAGVADLMNSAASAFAVGNAIIKSASHFVPPAGALGELKDMAESAMTVLTSMTGWLGRGVKKFTRAKKHVEPEPEPTTT